MADYTLPRVWKNKIFEMINSRGMEPASFAWETYQGPDDNDYSLIRHKAANCSFKFGRQDGDEMWCELRPGPDRPVLLEYFRSEGVLGLVRQWLGHVREETSAPDLWAQIETYALDLPDSARGKLDSGPILEADRKRIKLAVDMVRERARQRNLTEDQIKVIDDKLDYLVEASNRLTLKDWVNASVGTLMGMAMQTQVQVAVYKEIIEPLLSLIKSGIRLLTQS